jgi:hypothetical protein
MVGLSRQGLVKQRIVAEFGTSEGAALACHSEAANGCQISHGNQGQDALRRARNCGFECLGIPKGSRPHLPRSRPWRALRPEASSLTDLRNEARRA